MAFYNTHLHYIPFHCLLNAFILASGHFPFPSLLLSGPFWLALLGIDHGYCLKD
jgi:hypothetical protein